MNTTFRLAPSSSRSRSTAQRGMTLVELMVALLLGLVTTYFIAQVFAVAEGQKRTATFGSDAQVNGAVALHTLRRHLLSAGYGVTGVVEGLGCPIKGQYGTAGSTTPAPAMNLAPIEITRSAVASAPSDQIAVLTSTKTSFAAVTRIAKPVTAVQANNFQVDSSVGAVEDDTILAIPMSWAADNSGCVFFTVKPDNSDPSTTMTTAQIPRAPSGSASSWNAAASSVWPPGGFKENDVLVNFGKVRRMVFGVDSDTFQVITWTPQGIGNAEQLNSGVVLLKALYGRDNDNDGVVDTYDTTTPVTNADWQKVMSVRIAMVARSGQREKDEVTTAEPTWNVGANVAVSYVPVPGGPATLCAAGAGACQVPLPVSQLVEWKHYRYKVFDTAVPLRNMLWNLGS
ncbi:MAG: PilW family protein [Burkholderiales bacterium]